MKLFTTLLSALALATYSTTASPVVGADLAAIKRSELIVYSPTVIQPKQGAKWKIGSHQLVLWDTSNVPPGAEKNTGEILLGYDDGTGSENLDFDHPLASGFPITSGSHSVKVPNVTPRSTYFIVLLGDSGNTSPRFNITH